MTCHCSIKEKVVLKIITNLSQIILMKIFHVLRFKISKIFKELKSNQVSL